MHTATGWVMSDTVIYEDPPGMAEKQFKENVIGKR